MRAIEIDTVSATLPASYLPITVLGFGAVATVAVLACWVGSDSRPAIALAVFTIAAAGLAAASRFGRYGIIDALGLYCLAFIAYNGVILLRLATMPASAEVTYPWSFTQSDFARAGLLDASAAAAISVTVLLLNVISAPRKLARDRSRGLPWFAAGTLMYIAGLAMYFVQWRQAGGYLAGLKAGRGIRFEVFGSTGLSWPYTAFAIPGLAGLWYAAEQHNSRAAKWTAWAALLLWCVLLLPQGDRLYVLEALIAVVAVRCTCRRKILRLTAARAGAILMIYLLSAMFGEVRSVVAPLASGEMTWSDAQAAVSGIADFNWLKPEHSELAGPYFSLLQAASNPSEGLLEGKNSYVEALLAVLPKAIYPGEKPSLLAHRFELAVHSGRGAVTGWGFSPVAEAFLNFGHAGVALVFMLWAVLFFALDAVKYMPRVGPVLFAVMLPEVVNANRMDFRNVYGETMYYLGGVIVAFVLAELLGVFFRPRPEHA